MSDEIQNSNLIPNADNTLSLGSDSKRFSDVYASEFHGVATYSGSALSIGNHYLGNLADVTLSSVSSGDVLVWTGTTWSANSVCNPTHLDNLTDVDTSGVTSGQVLRYNATSGNWEAQTITPASIGTTFVTLSDTPNSLTPNAFLKVNAGGTAVENFADPGYVSDLTSFTTTDLTEGTNLYYTDTRWDTRFATKTTDDLAEGNNQYFTNSRFDTRLASKTTDDISEGSNLYYTDDRFDNRLASKTTTDLTEGTNLYYTTGRFDTAFSGKTTTNLSEGTNLYYTDTRFDTRLSAKTTDDLTEGSTNLYYTDTKVDNRVANLTISSLSDVDTSGVADNKILKYNASSSRWEVGDDNVPVVVDWANISNIPTIPTAVSQLTNDNNYLTPSAFDTRLAGKTTDDLAEGSNLYYTDDRFDTRFASKRTDDLVEGTKEFYTSAKFDTRLAGKTTDDLAEGSNLYYTEDRVDQRIQVYGGYLLSQTQVSNIATNAVGTDELDLASLPVSTFSNDSGYISSYTETDTLQTVTQRGNVTNRPLSVENQGIVKLAAGETLDNYTVSGVGVKQGNDIVLCGDINSNAAGDLVKSINGLLTGNDVSNAFASFGQITAEVSGTQFQFAGRATETDDGNTTLSGIFDFGAGEIEVKLSTTPYLVHANFGKAGSYGFGIDTDGHFVITDSNDNTVYRLPKTDGSAGQALRTNGNGSLYWG